MKARSVSESRISRPVAVLSHSFCLAVLALISAGGAGAPKSYAGQLPVPCSTGACGANGPNAWLGSGLATLASTSNKMTVTQTSQTAQLNWASFNVSAGSTVTFAQPSSSAIALNRIYQANPAQIFGALNANGVVYLLNQNGILFGAGSQINVGGLVASSLNLSPSALTNGIASSASQGLPAFQPYTDSNGNPLVSGPVTVQSGASITSASGQVLMFAPTVSNQGTIMTPDGQTILGAGQSIFLTDSTDPNIRGLLIEVGGQGTVTNGSAMQANIGQIIADRGNVTLAGLAVNQDGVVSATTTVRENGSIVLQAQSLSQPVLPVAGVLQADTNGTVTLGSNSVTAVTLEGSSTDVTVAANTQPQSLVTVTGATIDMLSQARITATAGNVTMSAYSSPAAQQTPTGTPDNARIWLAPGSVIDVSGAQTSLPMSDNTLTVHLTSTELADFPQQKASPLLGENITVDLRDYGTGANGTTWIGTPIADLSSDISAIQSNVFQRSLNAGTITLQSSGAVLVSSGATLDVAGGVITWLPGYIKTTELLNTQGQIVPIAAANPAQSYVGTLDSISVGDPRWGNIVAEALADQNPKGQYESGYVQGASAGTVDIVAPVTVLDGNINGTTVQGPLQVVPAAAAASGAPTFNQLPLGAALILGSTSDIGTIAGNDDPIAITFASGTVLDQLSGPGGGAFNPLTDPLPAGMVSQIRPALLGANGVTQLTVAANGSIDLPSGVALSPGAGGSVTLEAGEITVAGTIDAPSGSIALLTNVTPLFNGQQDSTIPELTLTAQAQLLAMGSWVNDSPMFGQSDTPLFTSGGHISVESLNGSMLLSPGALIDVTAGAQLTSTEQVVAGKGGSITVADNPANLAGRAGVVSEIAATFYGFAVQDGASLSISAPFICVSSETCSSPGGVQISPQLLIDDGFSRISLTGDAFGLTVGGDVDIAVAQQNLMLTPGAAVAPSGTPIGDITTIVSLPAYNRVPESLSLSALAGQQQQYADLTISSGAKLSFDPGASLTLTTDSRIFQNGVIEALGGDVSLSIVPGGLVSLEQGIWLGSDSVIDVAGTVQYTPNPTGLVTGTIFSAGTVNVSAGQGFLFAASGSLINASGYATPLNVPTYGSQSNAYELIDDAGQAGVINVSAAAGLFLGGGLEAQPAPVAGAAGGSLNVSLLGQGAAVNEPEIIPQVPASLQITVAETAPWVAEGQATPLALLGSGVIPESTITGGGFDQLRLAAPNLQDPNNYGFRGGGQGIGSIIFDSGVQLSPAVSLVLDTPTIAVNGTGAVNLTSSYVALGSDDMTSQLVNANASSGSATLNISGQFVDLIGNFSLQGLAAANITSATDMRAIGVIANTADASVGSLTSTSDLTLTAQQLYPATLSSYSIDVLGVDSQGSTLTVLGQPGTPASVYSAGGALTLQATNIVNSGDIRAPIGDITLNAQQISLTPGSLISVSADGLTIPFGETQGGLAWVYPIQPLTQTTLVYGTGAGEIPLPQKQVSLNAQQLNLATGATIDISGGGDLQAYEFVPGIGGTQDVLSPTVSPNTYAILPTANLAFAPYDPLIYQGLALQPNQSVYLSGGDGLAAGTYALLPARYALLPGAYLVTEVSGYSNLTPGDQVQQLNGSVIVSGRLVYAGTTLGATQTSGFDITPGTYALQEAQYTTTSANSFFSGQAAAAGVVSSPLPQDAGIIAIESGVSLNLSGAILAAPAAGGRGGSLDLSANNLVVTNGSQAEPAGTVDIDANQIDGLGITSVLLGGTRQYTTGVTDVSVQAEDVTVDSGVTLSGPEVLLVASQQIQIQTGATLEATGSALSAGNPLNIPAGAALMRVSTGPQVGVESSGTGTPGEISVASGATVSAPGSIAISAGSSVDFEGSLAASGASVYLGSNELALGTVPQSFVGTVLSSAELTSLANSNLTLDSSSELQVFGPVALNVSELAIDAPGVEAMTPNTQLTIATSLFSVQGAGATAPPGAGGGQLTVNAGSVDLGSGAFAVSGFAQSTLTAAKDLSVSGSGQLSTSGNLVLSAGVFQTVGAFDYAVSATGQLSTSTPNAIAATASAAPGGSLTLQGSNVLLGGNFSLPAGLIVASATGAGGSVEVTTSAELNVGGQGISFAGETMSSAGGHIDLQSASGSVTIDSGATINVSSGTGVGAGGALTLSAPNGAVSVSGTVLGSGGPGQPGASLSVDAQSLDFASLLNTVAAGGLTGDLSVHERGAGDLVVAATNDLQAQQIELTADGGSIDIMGELNAGAANGGVITLNAQNNVVVGGTLLATATGNANRGGDVNLASATGGVYVNPTAEINVGGQSSPTAALQSTGEIWITAPSTSVLSVLNADPTTRQLVLGGSVLGASVVQIEGSEVYQVPAGVLPALDESAVATNPLYANAAAFMQNSTAIAAALQINGGPTIQVVPGVQIQSNGDLTINTTFDLSTWRFNGVPGVLTLRAAGNIYVDASISDGFPSFQADGSLPANYELSPSAGPSWSYQLTAGADLGSADPLGLAAPSALPATGGSVILAAGIPSSPTGGANAPIMIRTGTGTIQIAAAQDLVLGNQASVIYTAGEAGPGTVLNGISGQGLDGFAYPINGGSIDINVGRNVIGATSDELFSDWLWWTGANTTRGVFVPTAWTIAFSRFEQGIGALGGGDLTITAGGNIDDLGAVVPSVGVPIPGQLAPTEENDGMLTIAAGGDISGGKFLDMAGSASITAGGQVDQGSVQAGSPRGLYPILAMGDSQFTVTARSGLTIEAVIDPTLLPQSADQDVKKVSYFGTYNNDSSVTLLSAGGNVDIVNETGAYSAIETTSQNVFDGGGNFGSDLPLRVMPPSVSLVAMGGDVNVLGSMDLWPAANGNLNLLASGNVAIADPSFAGGLHVVMSDADPNLSVPTPELPNIPLDLLDQSNPGQPGFNAAQPLHGGSYAANGAADAVPARIVALNGDISLQPAFGNSDSVVYLPKPVDVAAGGDIIDLGLSIEQYAADNFSTISAGGSLTYPSGRTVTGLLSQNTRGISVSGPGTLVIDVGGSVDLGTSNGIISYGNVLDPALPAGGAQIYLTAGVAPATSYSTFITQYLANESAYDSALIQYMEQITGQSGLDQAAALSGFMALSPLEQQPLLEDILVSELRAGGRAAAQPGAGHDNFTRAFAALEALFPGSNPDLAMGQTDPYAGDIDLYFSQIYTLAGGNISLFAPGGSIDVGLATPPDAFGVSKTPSELGIVTQSFGSVSAVAYGNIDVNQSRVFAADGGNILLWSTEGNIDAGRGAKSAISAPAPTISINSAGVVTVDFPPALTGSGIQTLSTTEGVSPGDVDLFAPHGVVNANEAGIVAGNLTIAATAVLGSNNITVSGTSVGVPVPVTGLGISAAAAGSSSASAASSALGGVSESNRQDQGSSLADAALSWLDVFVIGLGEEECQPTDLDCLKRQH